MDCPLPKTVGLTPDNVQITIRACQMTNNQLTCSNCPFNPYKGDSNAKKA